MAQWKEGRSLEHFESLRTDYSAAKRSRFRRVRTGVPASGSNADFHYRSESEFLRVIEYARDMDRNDAIVGQTIDRAVSNEVQEGFTLDIDTGSKEADRILGEKWEEWENEPELCDITGEMGFRDMEVLVSRQSKIDGDILALPLVDGQLQLIEAHRLRTPSNTKKNVIHGVELNSVRRRKSYWLTKDDIPLYQSVAKVSDIRQIAARGDDGHKQVFHVYNPKRVTQTRGVSALAPIFDICGMFDDINFAKLVQQQVVSCWAVFHQFDVGANPTPPPQAGAQTTVTRSDGSTETREGVYPGKEYFGRPGEKLVGFSPAVPNAEFFDHVRLILTLVGINLGLPLADVLLDGKEGNFSSARGVRQQAHIGFRRNQKALIRRFHTPVWRWKVRQWLAEEPALRTIAAQSDVNIFGHQWNPPSWKYLDPLKDVTADLTEIRSVMTSPRRKHAERAQDWSTIVTETVADNALAIRAAKTEAAKINKEFKDDQPVHWRELMSLPLPEGLQVNVTGEGGFGDDDDKEDPKDSAPSER